MFMSLEGVHMDFKQKIIELVSSCSDNELLELIYRFCQKLLG